MQGRIALPKHFVRNPKKHIAIFRDSFWSATHSRVAFALVIRCANFRVVACAWQAVSMASAELKSYRNERLLILPLCLAATLCVSFSQQHSHSSTTLNRICILI